MKPPSQKRVAASILIGLGLFWILVCNAANESIHQHFAWLAESFWRGRLDIIPERLSAGIIDAALTAGRFYWPLGPLPAILMMPLVPFLGGDAQPIAQIMFSAAIAWLAFVLARRTGFSRDDAVWLGFLFCFGSAAIGAISMNGPWYVGETVAMLCLLPALIEQRSRNRPAVIGLFAGLALMSRVTAGLGAIFFGLVELLRPGSWRNKAVRIARLAAPVAAAALLLGLYNYLRFGDPRTTGYDVNLLAPWSPEAVDRAKFGLFSAAYFSRNLFYYFLALPESYRGLPLVSPYGVSFFLLSPAFLLSVRARRRYPEFVAAAAASALVLAVLLFYFTTGFWQFGPRYLLDILPYWYLLLLLGIGPRPLSRRFKALIAASAGLNAFLFIVFTAHYVLHAF